MIDSTRQDSSSGARVNRPWSVYPMAIWSFFGIGGFLFSLGHSLASSKPQLYQLGAILVLAFLLVMVVNILRMKRTFLVFFGVSCALMAAWESVIAGVLVWQHSRLPLTPLIAFYIVPSVILSFASLRSGFLASAVRYQAYREEEAMKKIAFRQIRS